MSFVHFPLPTLGGKDQCDCSIKEKTITTRNVHYIMGPNFCAKALVYGARATLDLSDSGVAIPSRISFDDAS